MLTIMMVIHGHIQQDAEVVIGGVPAKIAVIGVLSPSQFMLSVGNNGILVNPLWYPSK